MIEQREPTGTDGYREDEFWLAQMDHSTSFTEFHITQHHVDALTGYATAWVSNTCLRLSYHPILLWVEYRHYL